MAKDHGETDPRVKATASIWGIACGMMGICIPLIRVANAGDAGLVLPVMVLGAAALSSSLVWIMGRRKELPGAGISNEEIELMKQTILELHEHVDVLERKVDDQGLQLRINQASGSTGTTGSTPPPPKTEPFIATSRKEPPRN